MITTVRDLISHAKQHLDNLEYSSASLRMYQDSWNRFEKFCNITGCINPTREDCIAFLISRGIFSERPRTGWHKQQVRHINCLFDIWETGNCQLNYGDKKRISLPDCFADVFEAYCGFLSNKGLSEGTIYSKCCLARKFLNYLASVNIRDIKGISRINVYDYVSAIESHQTQSGTRFFLREFLRLLTDDFEASSDLANIYPVILENKRDTLPSVYTADELRKALGSLNADSRTPKRDRAVFMLAIELGLRAGDIFGLKLSYIDWRLWKLSFSQQKTKRDIVLPLPDECMFALLDYLKNERPQSDDPHIFLTGRAPYKPFCAYNTYHRIISDAYESAGVNTENKHRGLHSVRHSVAVNMLLNETPYPVITGVLGHESSNTTKSYLRVDVERLRTLCLEVPHGC